MLQWVTPNIYVGVARQFPENGDSKLVGFLIQNTKSSGPSNSAGAGMEPMDGHRLSGQFAASRETRIVRQNVPDLGPAF
jgi:hypothetical protein